MTSQEDMSAQANTPATSQIVISGLHRDSANVENMAGLLAIEPQYAWRQTLTNVRLHCGVPIQRERSVWIHVGVLKQCLNTGFVCFHSHTGKGNIIDPEREKLPKTPGPKKCSVKVKSCIFTPL